MNGKSPDAFRTISEVADWLGVNAHVLRFWESKFSQVKPVKRAGGRRYYRRADMELLGGIQKLLHEDGMTIKGVQKVLRDQGVKAVSAMSRSVDEGPEEADIPPTAEVETVSNVPAPQNEPEAAPEPPPAVDVEAEPAAEPEDVDTEVATPASTSQPMPLFSHHDPEEAPAPEVAEAHERAPESASENEPDGPVIAPLPSPDLPLVEALGYLVPMQIAPERLAPIHAGMVALRERMGAAG